MNRYLPALAWFFGGIGGTIFICFVLFLIGFLARDEVHGSRIGIWAGVIAISIYVIMPVGILGSLFMTLAKLRGVIDDDAPTNSGNDV